MIVTAEASAQSLYKESVGWFNIKMSSYQYRKSHCGDKTILRPSYLHNGISYTGKMTSSYWIGAQVATRTWIRPELSAITNCDNNEMQVEYHIMITDKMSHWLHFSSFVALEVTLTAFGDYETIIVASVMHAIIGFNHGLPCMFEHI